MNRPLQPSDVLIRDLAAQLAPLSDGRLLARHEGGITLLHGVAAEDLRRLLDLVDGTRTADEICAALAEEYDATAVRQLLASLAGDLIHIVPPPEAEQRPPWARPMLPPRASASTRIICTG